MKLSDFVFCDFEASSLSEDSFPISFGYCSSLMSGQVYISPEVDWTDWSIESQKIHGITKDFLDEHGIPASLVVHRLNSQFFGRVLVCDRPYMDKMWLDKLCSSAKVIPAFELIGVSDLSHLSESDLYAIDAIVEQEKTHCAYDDAKALYNAVCSVSGMKKTC